MLRKTFRWIVRAAILIVVLFVIMLISDRMTHRVQPDSILEVTLKGPVVERGVPGVLGGVLSAHETPLNLVRNAMIRAERDPRIVGLSLKVIDPQMDLAQAQELAALVRRFKTRGKPTAAYLEGAGEFTPGNGAYIVAASTGEVSLMPEGTVNISGVGGREDL